MRLADQVIWITGASSGIGAALAQALAAQGARLILSARRTDRLEEVKQACGSASPVRVFPMDMADHHGLAGKAEEALALFGEVHVLVHNAGLSQRSTAAETGLSVTQRILDVNFLGPVALTRAVLPHMLARGSGQLVVVTSVLGKFGAKLRSSYAASKHALHGYFDSLRAELHASGIRVTLITPGFIRTEISESALTADGSAHGRMDQGQAQGMDPADCARRMVRIIAKGKQEAAVGGLEVGGVWLKRWCPSLLSVILRRMRMK